MNPVEAETQIELGPESEPAEALASDPEDKPKAAAEALPSDPEDKPKAADSKLSDGHAKTDDANSADGKVAEQAPQEDRPHEKDSAGRPPEDVFDAPDEAGFRWACAVHVCPEKVVVSSQNPCKANFGRVKQTQLAEELAEAGKGGGRGRGGRGGRGRGGRSGGAAMKKPAAAPQPKRAALEEPVPTKKKTKAEPDKDADEPESEAPEPPKTRTKANPNKAAEESEAPEPPKKKKKADPSKDADESEAPEPPKKKKKANPKKAADESEAPEPTRKEKKAKPSKAADESGAAAAGKAGNDVPGKAKTTFARRYCPKSGRNHYKWLGLRDAYCEQVAQHFDYPSKHEDCSVSRCLWLRHSKPQTQTPNPTP